MTFKRALRANDSLAFGDVVESDASDLFVVDRVEPGIVHLVPYERGGVRMSAVNPIRVLLAAPGGEVVGQPVDGSALSMPIYRTGKNIYF